MGHIDQDVTAIADDGALTVVSTDAQGYTVLVTFTPAELERLAFAYWLNQHGRLSSHWQDRVGTPLTLSRLFA